MFTCAANRAPRWEFGVRIMSERQGPVWHFAPHPSLPGGVRTAPQTHRYFGHIIMSLWCVVSISDGMCVPMSAAGAQLPHTLSLGLLGGFCGRHRVSCYTAQANTPSTSCTSRAWVCSDRTCVLMTVSWLCWRWVPTGSANLLVFLPKQRTVVCAVCAVMCVLQHVFLWCLLVSLFIHYVSSAQAKTI